MKLYSQCGSKQGNKVNDASQILDGIIARPRDIASDKINAYFERYSRIENFDLFFDPQLYVIYKRYANSMHLSSYTNYAIHRNSNWYERETNIRTVIESVIEYQDSLPLTGIISPNIVIERSFDNKTSIIAKNFIYNACDIQRKTGNKKPLYITLAIDSEALQETENLKAFVNEITILDDRPTGFYLLIETPDHSNTAYMLQPRVLAGAMFLNYTLALNDFEILNGYSDLFSPFYAAVGGSAGSTGWWANLRQFSLYPYKDDQPEGGRLPIQRYLSIALFSRILYTELNAWKDIIPEIVNNLPNDALFPDNEEPARSNEVLQHWESIKEMNKMFSALEIEENIAMLRKHLIHANALYDYLDSVGLRPHQKSNRDHIEPMIEALNNFEYLAEFN